MTASVLKSLTAFISELEKRKGEVSIVVAYSKASAEPILIAPGYESNVTGEGKEPIQAGIVEESLEGKDYVEIKNTTIFHAYKNPRCQILTASGQWVRVC